MRTPIVVEIRAWSPHRRLVWVLGWRLGIVASHLAAAAVGAWLL
jgi:hypothetical protein